MALFLILLMVFQLQSSAQPGHLAQVAPPVSAHAELPATAFGLQQAPRFGVLSDSRSDEYRADDDRGSEPWKATTLNWIELLVRYRGLNFGPWGTREEPRRTGYAYNWARSAATAETMIEAGQHTGLAAQVRRGEVEYAVVKIGSNDFGPWGYVSGGYRDIYEGTLAGADLQQRLDRFIANVTTAVDTLLAAGPVNVVVIDVIDPSRYPPIQQAFPSAAGRQRVSEALEEVNLRLRAMADARENTVFMSHDPWMDPLIDAFIEDRKLTLAGVEFDLLNAGNEPHHIMLGDGVHLHTVGQALFANKVVLAALNEAWSLGIQPFTDEEIVEYAGLEVATGHNDGAEPGRSGLDPIYPNPSHSDDLTFSFELETAEWATLKVYDVRGREVATLLSNHLPAGDHRVRWQPTDLAGGVYLCRLETSTFADTKQLVLVR